MNKQIKECLKQLVVHHEPLIRACEIRRHHYLKNGDFEKASFWQAEIDAILKMKEQAETELREAKPAAVVDHNGALEPTLHGIIVLRNGDRLYIGE